MPLGDGAEAADFVLPDELLAALPRDPYKQLDLAHRITALAVSGRVSGLEREAGRLRAEAAGKDRENAELREGVVLLDTALQETNARLRSPMLTMADLPTGTRDPAREFRFPPGWFLEGSKCANIRYHVKEASYQHVIGIPLTSFAYADEENLPVLPWFIKK
ncbi:hypothetical protein ZEAMMB73_Zm00001d019442 [Zea mays]|uniref:Uncharacterized protein n=1 Tax=Zea mays TaxID=4577 RepID=A0A1D6HXG0_MAIZE|nr:hypothetical protein ZEAMMB73_Zm00001d019442 [Zea mays]